MAQYPGFGEMRWYTDAARLRAGRVLVALDAARDRRSRQLRARHPGQEEVYFVISGTVTFKVGDDVFEAGPQTAVRMSGEDVLLGPQRHRRRRRAADLLDQARRPAGTEQPGRLLARAERPRSASGSTPRCPTAERHLDFVAAPDSPIPPSLPWHWPERGDGERRAAHARAGSPRCSSATAASCASAGFTWWPWRERASGELIGLVGLNAAEVEGEPVVEVGWSVRAGALGRGLRGEAARGLARLGLRALRARGDRLLHDGRQRSPRGG